MGAQQSQTAEKQPRKGAKQSQTAEKQPWEGAKQSQIPETRLRNGVEVQPVALKVGEKWPEMLNGEKRGCFPLSHWEKKISHLYSPDKEYDPENNWEIAEVNLAGSEGLTDAWLYTLHTHRKYFKMCEKFVFSGAIHISDMGIYWLSLTLQAAVRVKEVELRGCVGISDRTLMMLLGTLGEDCTIDMRGTNITFYNPDTTSKFHGLLISKCPTPNDPINWRQDLSSIKNNGTSGIVTCSQVMRYGHVVICHAVPGSNSLVDYLVDKAIKPLKDTNYVASWSLNDWSLALTETTANNPAWNLLLPRDVDQVIIACDLSRHLEDIQHHVCNTVAKFLSKERLWIKFQENFQGEERNHGSFPYFTTGFSLGATYMFGSLDMHICDIVKTTGLFRFGGDQGVWQSAQSLSGFCNAFRFKVVRHTEKTNVKVGLSCRGEYQADNLISLTDRDWEESKEIILEMDRRCISASQPSFTVNVEDAPYVLSVRVGNKSVYKKQVSLRMDPYPTILGTDVDVLIIDYKTTPDPAKETLTVAKNSRGSYISHMLMEEPDTLMYSGMGSETAYWFGDHSLDGNTFKKLEVEILELGKHSKLTIGVAFNSCVLAGAAQNKQMFKDNSLNFSVALGDLVSNKDELDPESKSICQVGDKISVECEALSQEPDAAFVIKFRHNEGNATEVSIPQKDDSFTTSAIIPVLTSKTPGDKVRILTHYHRQVPMATKVRDVEIVIKGKQLAEDEHDDNIKDKPLHLKQGLMYFECGSSAMTNSVLNQDTTKLKLYPVISRREQNVSHYSDESTLPQARQYFMASSPFTKECNYFEVQFIRYPERVGDSPGSLDMVIGLVQSLYDGKGFIGEVPGTVGWQFSYGVRTIVKKMECGKQMISKSISKTNIRFSDGYEGDTLIKENDKIGLGIKVDTAKFDDLGTLVPDQDIEVFAVIYRTNEEKQTNTFMIMEETFHYHGGGLYPVTSVRKVYNCVEILNYKAQPHELDPHQPVDGATNKEKQVEMVGTNFLVVGMTNEGNFHKDKMDSLKKMVLSTPKLLLDDIENYDRTLAGLDFAAMQDFSKALSLKESWAQFEKNISERLKFATLDFQASDNMPDAQNQQGYDDITDWIHEQKERDMKVKDFLYHHTKEVGKCIRHLQKKDWFIERSDALLNRGMTFKDYPLVENKIIQLLEYWGLVFISDEDTLSKSQIVISKTSPAFKQLLLAIGEPPSAGTAPKCVNQQTAVWTQSDIAAMGKALGQDNSAVELLQELLEHSGSLVRIPMKVEGEKETSKWINTSCLNDPPQEISDVWDIEDEDKMTILKQIYSLPHSYYGNLITLFLSIVPHTYTVSLWQQGLIAQHGAADVMVTWKNKDNETIVTIKGLAIKPKLSNSKHSHLVSENVEKYLRSVFSVYVDSFAWALKKLNEYAASVSLMTPEKSCSWNMIHSWMAPSNARQHVCSWCQGMYTPAGNESSHNMVKMCMDCGMCFACWRKYNAIQNVLRPFNYVTRSRLFQKIGQGAYDEKLGCYTDNVMTRWTLGADREEEVHVSIISSNNDSTTIKESFFLVSEDEKYGIAINPSVPILGKGGFDAKKLEKLALKEPLGQSLPMPRAERNVDYTLAELDTGDTIIIRLTRKKVAKACWEYQARMVMREPPTDPTDPNVDPHKYNSPYEVKDRTLLPNASDQLPLEIQWMYTLEHEPKQVDSGVNFEKENEEKLSNKLVLNPSKSLRFHDKIAEIIANNTNAAQSVIIKVKTTSPNAYKVVPNFCILPPGQIQLFSLTRTDEASQGDKFMIQSLLGGDGMTVSEASGFMSENARDVIKTKLSVEFSDRSQMEPRDLPYVIPKHIIAENKNKGFLALEIVKNGKLAFDCWLPDTNYHLVMTNHIVNPTRVIISIPSITDVNQSSSLKPGMLLEAKLSYMDPLENLSSEVALELLKMRKKQIPQHILDKHRETGENQEEQGTEDLLTDSAKGNGDLQMSTEIFNPYNQDAEVPHELIRAKLTAAEREWVKEEGQEFTADWYSICRVIDRDNSGMLQLLFEGATDNERLEFWVKETDENIHPLGWFESQHDHLQEKLLVWRRTPLINRKETIPVKENAEKHLALQILGLDESNYCLTEETPIVPYTFFSEAQAGSDDAISRLLRLPRRCTAVPSMFTVQSADCNKLSEKLGTKPWTECGVSSKINHDMKYVLLPDLDIGKMKCAPLTTLYNNSQLRSHLICFPEAAPGSGWLSPTQGHFLNHGGFRPAEVLDNVMFEDTVLLTTQIAMKPNLMQQLRVIASHDKLFPKSEGGTAEIISVLESILQRYATMAHLVVSSFKDKSLGSLPVNIKGRDAVICPLLDFVLESSQNILTIADSAIRVPDLEQVLCRSHYFSNSLACKEQPLFETQLLKPYHSLLRMVRYRLGKIEELPMVAFKALPQLQMLSLLDVYKIKDLPAGISNSSSLQTLEISGSPTLRRLPPDLSECASLSKLILNQNSLDALPDNWKDNYVLEEVLISGNLLKTIPDSMEKLHVLSHLDLSSNPITHLPDSLDMLKGLKKLNLSGLPWVIRNSAQDNLPFTKQQFETWKRTNKNIVKIITEQALDNLYMECDKAHKNMLTPKELALFNSKLFYLSPRLGHDYEEGDEYGGVPSCILELTNLEELYLDQQAIHSIPAQMHNLSNLRVLSVKNNPLLENIASSVGVMKLTEMHLSGCSSLQTPPLELVGRGFASIMAYLRRLEGGYAVCMRTKLMLVGIGGVGKTSLLKALMSIRGTTKGTTGENVTDGIDITSWEVPTISGNNIQYSCWDFAGQSVYYNTHQFFLSHRAIYLMLWNTRQGFEHAGLDFWLSSIQCHAPEAPVLVVATQCDLISKVELAKEELKKKYPQIIGFFNVSATNGLGIQDLKKAIIDVTLDKQWCPYIGEKIPQVWLNLEKNILDARKEMGSGNDSVMKYSRVVSLGEEQGLYSEKDIQLAVQFLHDQGTVQYFDTEFLREYVVINPQWIVDVMACIVNVNESPIKDGRFEHKYIKQVWKLYPEDMHEWLLRLSEEFDLTFPLPNEKANIVPCLLPEEKPQFDWPDISEEKGMKETKMIYEFAYLPAGLFNRAQVRLFQFSDSKIIWKRGSFLNKNSHKALVHQVSDYDLEVRVQGSQPQNVMLLIHEVFESLVKDMFKGRDMYDIQVPCPDCISKEMTSDPTMFAAKTIRLASARNIAFLQCQKYFHIVPISEAQGMLPPESSSNLDFDLGESITTLDKLEEDLVMDLFVLYCDKDVPKSKEEEKTLTHPRTIANSLQKSGYKCWYSDKLWEEDAHTVALALRTAKSMLVLMSSSFTEDEQCSRLFLYGKDSLFKPYFIAATGKDLDWRDTEIGMVIGPDKIFVNFRKIELFEEKMEELKRQLENAVPNATIKKSAFPKCFVSYCWKNSHSAVKLGTKATPGSLGWDDPRQIAQDLEDAGVSVWLDIKQKWENGLFGEICLGIKEAAVVLICVSTEYATVSPNCMMELRFSLCRLEKPVIIAVVGTDDSWKDKEAGILLSRSNSPMVSFQKEDANAKDKLIELVKNAIPKDWGSQKGKKKQSGKGGSNSHQNAKFQEEYELAQRRLMRQIMSYSSSMFNDSYPRLIVIDFMSQNAQDHTGDHNKNIETIATPRDVKYEDNSNKSKTSRPRSANRTVQMVTNKKKNRLAEYTAQPDEDDPEAKDIKDHDDNEKRKEPRPRSANRAVQMVRNKKEGKLAGSNVQPDEDDPEARDIKDHDDNEKRKEPRLRSANRAVQMVTNKKEGKLAGGNAHPKEDDVGELKRPPPPERRLIKRLSMAHIDVDSPPGVGSAVLTAAKWKKMDLCFKFLCENEEDWHCSTEVIALDHLSVEEKETLVKSVAPFLGRLYTILKHGDVFLNCLKDNQPHCQAFRDFIDEFSRVDAEESSNPILEAYRSLRMAAVKGDVDVNRGNLARCHMPTGKMLWLCEKHQKGSHVRVMNTSKETMTSWQTNTEMDTFMKENLTKFAHMREPHRTHKGKPQKKTLPVVNGGSVTVVKKDEEVATIVKRTTGLSEKSNTRPSSSNSHKGSAASRRPSAASVRKDDPMRKEHSGDALKKQTASSQACHIL